MRTGPFLRTTCRTVSLTLGAAALLAAASGCSAAERTSASEADVTGDVTGERGVVVPLSSLSVDGTSGQLAFSYSTGGGCAEHKPEAALTLAEGEFSWAATVTVSDVASAPDYCEALLHLDGTADLHRLITSAAEREGTDLTGQAVSVRLPALSLVVGTSAGAPAAAPRGAPLEDMSSMSFDPGTGRLSFGYRIGGGCATHTPATSVELEKRDEYTYVAKLRVFDVPAAEDSCEALLSINGSADLPTLVADAAKAANVDLQGRTVTLELPAVSVLAP